MKTEVGRTRGNRGLYVVAGIALSCAWLFAAHRAAGAEADLIVNGDMETQSGGRPYGWGGAGEALEGGISVQWSEHILYENQVRRLRWVVRRESLAFQ